MSDDEDLELQALQRQLDDAFETTRPRRGFEDQLWLRMQARRPLSARIQDSLAGLFRGISEAPAVPAAAVATLLVVVIAAGMITLSGVGRGGGGGGATSTALNNGSSEGPRYAAPAGAFGRLPAPAFSANSDTSGPGPTHPKMATDLYLGPVTLTWAGQLNVTFTSAPVWRYREPSTATADQFATSLGASSRTRAAGYLGTYSGTDITLQVRGTVQVPAHEPFFVLDVSGSSSPSIGASPRDTANSFLGQRSISPQWLQTVTVDGSGDDVRVHYLRQFQVDLYGNAFLVNANGDRYGMEVEFKGGQLVRVTGPLPLAMDSAFYSIISADQAIASAVASTPSQAASGSLLPTVQLTKAEVVYVLASAGATSFYEPAFLFSGTFTMNGTAYTKRVLVPAVDPSQRSS